MVRLVLEINGWRTDYLGANVPWAGLREAVERQKPDLVLLAGRASAAFSTEEFLDLVRWCDRQGILLGIGGSWARGGRGRDERVSRFRSLRGFERWLRSGELARRAGRRG